MEIPQVHQQIRKLSVPNILQERSNWCWAGTSVSVLNYFGKTPSQDQYVRYVKGGSYNNPATSREIQYGLSGYGVSSAISSGAKSMIGSKVKLIVISR